jgi:muramoyltetrapeptide carboxypeptidase
VAGRPRTPGRTPPLRLPRRLRPGGTIGIAAPAGPIDEARLVAGVAMLEAAGFKTLRRDDVCARRGYLAGDDARRAAELMQLVEDPRVEAIVCARGGFGSQRILARLDARRVRAAAKPLVGFSDVTTLHLWLRRRAGLASFHGPMLERGGGLEAHELAALVAALTGEGRLPVALAGEAGFGGSAEGRLVGGNLTLLAASLGTPWEIDTRGAILLFEEVHEAPYRIDRLLGQLGAAGKLARLAGVGVGGLVGCEAEPRGIDPALHGAVAGPSAREVVEEALRPLGVPVAFGLPFGHGRPNLVWPLGVRARLDGRRATLHILERGVRRS